MTPKRDPGTGNPKWSERKDHVLRLEWGRMTVAELAIRLGCGLSSIQEHAIRLGLRPKREQKRRANDNDKQSNRTRSA